MHARDIKLWSSWIIDLNLSQKLSHLSKLPSKIDDWVIETIYVMCRLIYVMWELRDRTSAMYKMRH